MLCHPSRCGKHRTTCGRTSGKHVIPLAFGPRLGVHRRRRAGGRGAPTRGPAARCAGAGGRRRAHHRQGRGRGARDGRADARRRTARQGADARLDGRAAPAQGAAHAGQKQAVKFILSEKDRTVGVQGYAGTGKTKMLARARTLVEKKGWRMVGLAPSVSAARAQPGIRYRVRNPPAIPRPQRGRCRRQADEEGREGNARGVGEDGAGG